MTMRLRKSRSIWRTLSVSLFAALICVASAAQITVTKPPAPTATLAGPHRQQPPGGQRPPNNAGDVEGFVYWDANTITHKPAGTCSGLAVNVTKAGSPHNRVQIGNNFKYAGQVKALLYGGKQAVYDVCIYAYDKLPIGSQLQAQLVITEPGAFSPIVAPQSPTISPITIINAQCNMLPAIVPSTVGDLTSHWGSCQNRAYDVNFALVPSAHLLGTSQGTRGTLLNGNDGAINPGPINSPSRGMLDGGLNPAPQRTGSLAAVPVARDPGPTQTGSRGMLVPAVKPTTTQAGTRGTPGQLLPAKSGAPMLTNADVIGLVKGGVPESAVINQIKSSTGQFDFSPQGCSALTQAHVGSNVLSAMSNGGASPCFTGGVRTGAGNGADDLNPQPYPPKGTLATPGSSANTVQLNPQPYPPKGTGATTNSASGSTRQTRASLKKSGSAAVLKPIKLPSPKALKRITTPLAQQNASIMAVLEQQRLAAQQDSAAMKSASRATAAARTPAMATNFQENMPASRTAPSQTQSAPGNSLSSMARLQPFNSVVLACLTDQSPRITRVNGGESPGIFTPEAKYNQYTIVGCSFGEAQGTAHVYGQNGFTANLNIDYWSNNGITAHLDPSLSGVLDQNSVTLVVVPVGQQQIQKSGYRFYAARGMPMPDGSDQEVQLAYNSMPESSASLFNIPDLMLGFDQLPSNAGSNFPSFTFQGTAVAGWVFRYGYGHCDRIATGRTADCYANGDVPCNGTGCSDFFGISNPGANWPLKSDTWDFSKLAPGFQINDYQLYVSTLDPKTLCGAWDDLDHTGYFEPDWGFNLNSQNQITVTWAVNRCDDTEFGTRDNMAVQSAYGLAVWVMGPRCIDAWTGQKDQSCMAKVKQILG
jgi:hypothetical protein